MKRFLARLNPRNMNLRSGMRTIGLTVFLVILLLFAGVVYWSNEPDLFDVQQVAEEQAASRNENLVTGYATTSALIIAQVMDMVMYVTYTCHG